MDVFRAAWAAIVDLLVEDGWIASGTIIALALTGLLSLFATSDALILLIGPALFIMLMALLVANLYSVGRRLGD